MAQSCGSAEKQVPAPGLLQGRPLKAVDGTGIRPQDSHQNRQAFPPAQNQFGRPSFPILQTVVLFSMASGAILARAVGSLAMHELRLLLELRPHLQPKDILLGERAYGVYVLAAGLQSEGVDLIARLNARSRRIDFRQSYRSLGPCDALFVWSKPNEVSPLLSPDQWAALSEKLTVRILRVRIQRPGFRTRELTIITTLLDAQLYPAQQILEGLPQAMAFGALSG